MPARRRRILSQFGSKKNLADILAGSGPGDDSFKRSTTKGAKNLDALLRYFLPDSFPGLTVTAYWEVRKPGLLPGPGIFLRAAGRLPARVSVKDAF
jgi:hypothetical protein